MNLLINRTLVARAKYMQISVRVRKGDVGGKHCILVVKSLFVSPEFIRTVILTYEKNIKTPLEWPTVHIV